MIFRTVLLFLYVLNNHTFADIVGKQYALIPELFYQDNFDKCMLLGDEALFCSVKFTLEPTNPDNVTDTWSYIKNLSSNEYNYRHDILRHYICVPKTCPNVSTFNEYDPLLKKELEECYNTKYKDYQLRGSLDIDICTSAKPKYPIDWFDILAGLFFISYAIFVLYATYYDQVITSKISKENNKQEKPSLRENLFSTFSIIRNWNRFTTIKMDTVEIQKLRAIQGLRFYNTAIVVSSHTMLAAFVLPQANTRFAETLHQKVISTFYASSHLCLTTFFLLSSFLLSYEIFKYLKDKKEFTFKMGLSIFVGRLFRLTPTLAVIILFHATWLRHLGSGPLWDTIMLREFRNCRKNGWTNLLYLNTVIDRGNMCLQTSWWLAQSTQYTLIGLVLICILKKYEKQFWWIIGGVMSIHIVGTFTENYYYDLPSQIYFNPELMHDFDALFKSVIILHQVQSFVGNISGHIVGIAFGYYYAKHINDGPEDRIFNTKFRVAIWWIISLGIGFGCVLVPGLIVMYNPHHHDAFWAAVYMALSRPLFAFFLVVLLLGFTEGVGGIALKITTWAPTYILGRLTFSVYLLHQSLVMTRTLMQRYPIFLTEYIIISQFFGDLVTVHIGAMFLTLFVELPLSALQKLLYPVNKEIKEKGETSNKTE